ncbi:putative acetylornithine aminotransferase [Mariannaea sp. PMI_226]|nr:putative acetylornithine aminotransferase [Mariannaea sp. PMI_226]
MGQDPATSYAATALKAAQAQYIQENPKSQKLQFDSREYMPGGNTRTILHVSPFPLTFESGEGATLTSVDGDTYLDFLGEYSAGLFGHSNTQIKDAVTAALAKGWNFGGQCTYEKILAKKVVERFEASGMEHVRFTNSGTESNTMAIAAAVSITGRKKILVFSGGYHGGTLIFPMEFMRNPNVPNSNLPHEFVFAPYNNISETDTVISGLPANSLAAILVEPLQGSGGCRQASPEFLRYLRHQADQLGALFIVDEVMASRLGVNGYSASVGVRADLLTLGKYIGGGMTFGAFGGRRDIMALFDPNTSRLQHPGTYNNNIVTMSAGIVALDIYDKKAVAQLNKRGTNMKLALQDVLIKYGLYAQHSDGASRNIVEIDSFEGPTTIKQKHSDSVSQEQLPKIFITGQGSMLNIRFSGEDCAAWQSLFYHHMLARKIYLAPRGYTPLHLAISDSDVAEYVAGLEEFVKLHHKALTS